MIHYLLIIVLASSTLEAMIAPNQMRGVGLDFSPVFTMFQDNRASVEEKSLSRKEREAEVKSCEFIVKKESSVSGVCTVMGACKVGTVLHFASPCTTQRTVGQSCRITVPDYQEVRGECSPGGHCLGVSPCKEGGCQREKYTKYSHEKCSKETETAPPRGPPEDRLRLDPSFQGCKGIYSPKAVIRLERICTDCYNLYREIEVFHQCTDQCFTSNTFLNCAKSLLINKIDVKSLVENNG